jgi:hypothetical protein
MFNHWLTCLWIPCRIKWKGLEMVDKMCVVFCLKHGKVCKNAMIKRIVWNDQHFLFLSRNKRLVGVKCSSWKTSFWEIEMDFWMYIWWHASIMESLIFLFFVFVGWQINKELNVGGISQFAMNRLRNKHHLNVNVQKWGPVFVKCIVSESLKDLISKLEKNSNEVLEYETKLKKHIFHQ